MNDRKMIYLVITSDGHWGRAEDLEEAFENASLSRRDVRCMVYRLPEALVSEFGCTDYGTARWQYAAERWAEIEPLQTAISELAFVGTFYAKRIGDVVVAKLDFTAMRP